MKRKYRTRKQKVILRSVLVLLLASLLTLVIALGRILTPQDALEAAENLCGTGDTQVIAQHEAMNATFYLSYNESTLMVSRFEPWMNPEDALVGAIDLTKAQPEDQVLAGQTYTLAEDHIQEVSVVYGQNLLEPAPAVRAYFYEARDSQDGTLIQPSENLQFFWLWLEAPRTETWEEGHIIYVCNIPRIDRLALLDREGTQIFSTTDLLSLYPNEY